MEITVTDLLVISTNLLVVLASLALALVTWADVEKDQQRTIRELIRALVKANRNNRKEEVK